MDSVHTILYVNAEQKFIGVTLQISMPMHKRQTDIFLQFLIKSRLQMECL